jgi:hypothetical protein
MSLQCFMRVPVVVLLLGIRQGRGPRVSSAAGRSSAPTPLPARPDPCLQSPQRLPAPALLAYLSPRRTDFLLFTGHADDWLTLAIASSASSSAALMRPLSSTSRPTTPGKEGTWCQGGRARRREGEGAGGDGGCKAATARGHRGRRREDKGAGWRGRDGRMARARR